MLQLRRLLRAGGFESEVFYEFLDPRLAGEARHYEECDQAADPERLILYHGSTQTAMNGWLIAAATGGQRVALDYHNITPAEYFSAWEPQAAHSMEQARRQLGELAPHVTAALADSSYNAEELHELGIKDAVACPILLDLEEYHARPSRPASGPASRPASRLAGGGPLWLFVGRVAPNKCQHDVIAAFAVYRRLYAPDARLAIVGAVTSGRYLRALKRLAADLGVTGAVDFAGPTPFPELLAYFDRADVFVCLSEHEGFCVPVIEAMELGRPVVAYSAAAVTETVADAGVLLEDKDPLSVAAAVHSVLSDDGRRQALVEAGRERARSFSLAATSERWLGELRRICAALPAPATR